VSGDSDNTESVLNTITWLLFMADSKHDLVAIAERSGISFSNLLRVAGQLVQKGLLEQVTS
jgi:aminopeptidase-like protein